MNCIRAALLGCLLVVGGCATASRQAVFPRHYTLGVAPPAAPVAPRAPAPILRVGRIDMPPWLQGTGLCYRLAYRNGDEVATYAHSDWAAPPADMLEQRLRGALAHGAAWRAVLGPGSTAQADLTVHVSIDDFCQVFSAPGSSVGVLQATATLVSATGAVLAQRPFRYRVPAPSADAQGAVAALATATRDFTHALRDWLAHEVPARP